MKKIIFSIFFALIAITSFAETHRVYCELVGQQGFMSSKVKVKVDFGQSTSFWKGDKDQQLVDENGKDIAFNSMIDAMNYMGNCGWSFLQAYAISDKNGNVYHWLLCKDVNNDDEIFEGFMTKEQYKNAQK